MSEFASPGGCLHRILSKACRRRSLCVALGMPMPPSVWLPLFVIGFKQVDHEGLLWPHEAWMVDDSFIVLVAVHQESGRRAANIERTLSCEVLGRTTFSSAFAAWFHLTALHNLSVLTTWNLATAKSHAGRSSTCCFASAFPAPFTPCGKCFHFSAARFGKQRRDTFFLGVVCLFLCLYVGSSYV